MGKRSESGLGSLAQKAGCCARGRRELELGLGQGRTCRNLRKKRKAEKEIVNRAKSGRTQ